MSAGRENALCSPLGLPFLNCGVRLAQAMSGTAPCFSKEFPEVLMCVVLMAGMLEDTVLS